MIVPRPWPATWAASCSISSTRLATPTTLTPATANMRAVARPMPWLAPVTSAVRPSKFNSTGMAVSVRLEIGYSDHLAPLLGFVGDQLAELGRRAREQHAAQV